MTEPLRFESEVELARWLALTPAELWWFADVEGIGRTRVNGPLAHYRYRFHAKPDGSTRLIEIPKLRLKLIQRRIARRLLAPLQLHDSVHGFVRGRSAITGARVHVGRALVLRVDLREFFASVSAGQVRAVLRRLGHADAVARALTGLCTNCTPRAAWTGSSTPANAEAVRQLWHRRQRYASPHLPTGAPTSPALANLVAGTLDLRLAALARSFGAAYTRYADDLTFSGDAPFRRDAERFFELVCGAVAEHGFAVHGRKTRFQGAETRQQVTGVVVNVHTSLVRRELERLEAIVHNCVRFGPAGQNRSGHPDFRSHLAGRIAHVASVHGRHGARLRERFAAIDWSPLDERSEA
ncbi:MAG: RNA-directed DNA polymerase [Deltaproteobacteria bacterium]|nr:RNA-directed DNA polymerase [Nannocystaceae bacterium]